MSIASNNSFSQMWASRRLDGYYGVQQANQGIMNNLQKVGSVPTEKLYQREKQLKFASLKAILMAKFAELAEKQSDKFVKDDIKKTLNTFA